VGLLNTKYFDMSGLIQHMDGAFELDGTNMPYGSLFYVGMALCGAMDSKA
jgi:hypothetical protein